MPSRRSIAIIILFWLVTAGYVAYRDVLPRLFPSGSPQIDIELADEASQTVPIRWAIYRGGLKIGRLITSTSYDKADDTFWLINEYKQLELEVGGVKGVIPELTTTIRITRSGVLREQSLNGKIEGYSRDKRFAEAEAHIHGTVIEGQLISECEIKSSFGDFKQTLEPVRVPEGQILNPLQPVNRLTNLRPGHSWYVQLSSPLDDATDLFLRKKLEEQGFKLQQKKQEPVFAQVMKNQQNLDWNGQVVSCWVIEYQQDEPVARTWVRASDGKVLKQEAFRGGEQLTIERDY